MKMYNNYKLNADHVIKHLSFGSFMSHGLIINQLKKELSTENWEAMLSFSPLDNMVATSDSQVSYLYSGNVINTMIDIDDVT